jgi:hypothetical protein
VWWADTSAHVALGLLPPCLAHHFAHVVLGLPTWGWAAPTHTRRLGSNLNAWHTTAHMLRLGSLCGGWAPSAHTWCLSSCLSAWHTIANKWRLGSLHGSWAPPVHTWRLGCTASEPWPCHTLGHSAGSKVLEF